MAMPTPTRRTAPLAARSPAGRSPAARLVAVGLVLAALAGGCATLDGNPLLGRWVATAPGLPGITLGTYEFGYRSMTALGITQEVEYAVSGDRVTVIPSAGAGIGLEVELIDKDTARLEAPLVGNLVTLRRVERRGLF
jgi:hypothetical protein